MLNYNGSVNPGRWEPPHYNRRDAYGGASRPEVGDLVAWRYGAWRVHEVRPYADVDLTEQDSAALEASLADVPEIHRADARGRRWPFHLVLRHVNGPIVILPGEAKAFKKLSDGSNTTQISFTSWPERIRWVRLPEPYMTCSCHGDPYPCQEIDRQEMADHQMRRFRKLEAAHAPGVCAHCIEPISTRQKIVTFPEPSRLLPGAPGPTYHAGRGECWAAAEAYERAGRLTDNPDIERLASCPGIRFIHEAHGMPAEKRIECTAGPFCTGLHGPPGHQREVPCWFRVDLSGNQGGYARPDLDCGYRQEPHRRCLGSDLSSGGTTLSPIAADLIWRNKQQQTPGTNG